MLRLFPKPRAAFLGVNIGPDSVQLVELSHARGSCTLEFYAIEPLVAPSSSGLNDFEPKAIGQALLQALERRRAGFCNPVLAMPDAEVIRKIIDMEAGLSTEDLDARIRVEADQYVPYAREDMALDFEVQGSSPRNPQQVEVLLVACPQEAIDLRQAALTVAGLQAHVIEVEVDAFQRCVERLGSQGRCGLPDACTALVDIGAHSTRLFVLQQGRITHSLEWFWGHAALQARVFQQYGLSLAAFSRIQSEGEPSLRAAFIEEALPFATEAVWHINNQLAVSERIDPATVSLILLAGAAAPIAGLALGECEALDIPVQIANPFIDISMSNAIDRLALGCDAPALMTACGLALRGFD